MVGNCAHAPCARVVASALAESHNGSISMVSAEWYVPERPRTSIDRALMAQTVTPKTEKPQGNAEANFRAWRGDAPTWSLDIPALRSTAGAIATTKGECLGPERCLDLGTMRITTAGSLEGTILVDGKLPSDWRWELLPRSRIRAKYWGLDHLTNAVSRSSK